MSWHLFVCIFWIPFLPIQATAVSDLKSGGEFLIDITCRWVVKIKNTRYDNAESLPRFVEGFVHVASRKNDTSNITSDISARSGTQHLNMFGLWFRTDRFIRARDEFDMHNHYGS